ncbi:MAG TPA: amidohydrolase [Gemmatimonadales bacterium]|jgi:aminobenzoyl-glutamate utilization protein B|nr:amidohydrolase [Gemmatimonadales bacterium]
MRIRALTASVLTVLTVLAVLPLASQQPPPPAPAPDPRLAALKRDLIADIDSRAKFTQEMVDQIFSFGELGFQEFETSKYLVGILRREGFTVQENYLGIPTAFVATWGSGKPVIGLGTDIDGIPQASQKPGVACRAPLVPGAPGHGEGHNSGMAVNLTAALALKKIMERDHIPGTIKVWPGVAEELVGTKAYYVRGGLFSDVDINLFSHVSSNFGVQWGSSDGNGLVSLQYTFKGQSAHAAGAPWRGRSALDAVELMDIAWNYRREHLRLTQRSHYVITNGGDQPNVVPQNATVWYYLRELDYPHIKELWAIADSIAQGAALMTGTALEPVRLMGSAWPQHFSKPIAEAMAANIQAVGMPKWTEEDQRFAKALQVELKNLRTDGLDTSMRALQGPVPEEQKRGGGSDDIGDVTWTVPTVTLRFPSNIPGLPGHNWTDAIAMATPVAHKGATAGAKAMAMTMLDILLTPKLVQDAKDYFNTVQTKEIKYQPLIRPQDRPAIELNKGILEKYREQMRPFYYDPRKYQSYLEQLGIRYPTVRAADGSCGSSAVP